MNNNVVAISQIVTLYNQRCVLLNFKMNEGSTRLPTLVLGIDKNCKEIVVKGEQPRLRGPYLSKILKLSYQGYIDVEYQYIDEFPTPYEYLVSLGKGGLPLETQKLLYILLTNTKES